MQPHLRSKEIQCLCSMQPDAFMNELAAWCPDSPLTIFLSSASHFSGLQSFGTLPTYSLFLDCEGASRTCRHGNVTMSGAARTQLS